MDLRSDVSQEAWKKGGKRVSSAEDWLIDTTQTARERTRNILRSPEVRDQMKSSAESGNTRMVKILECTIFAKFTAYPWPSPPLELHPIFADTPTRSDILAEGR